MVYELFYKIKCLEFQTLRKTQTRTCYVLCVIRNIQNLGSRAAWVLILYMRTTVEGYSRITDIFNTHKLLDLGVRQS